MDYIHSGHHVFLLCYHFIWCPKRRKKILIDNVERRLKQIIEEVAKERYIKILACEIMPDHVHLFVSAYPTVSPNSLIRWFKGRTSRLLRKEFPELLKLPSLWTRSYFVSTAGTVSTQTIQQYIESQKQVGN